MTTLSWKRRGPDRGHDRMGHRGKVAPQATLTFMPGCPPTFDPAPAPPKPQGNKNSWSGQMLRSFASMLNIQPTVNWVNPQMVRECPPPHMPYYSSPPPPPQYTVPPPAVNAGGGLWHAAPPGNQQHQMMMDPLLMLPKMGTNGYCPSGKMDINGYCPGGKMDTNGYCPGGKMDTNGYCVIGKVDTNGYCPGGKMDTGLFFPSTKMDTSGYYPAAKMETDCGYPRTDTNTQEWIDITSIPSTSTSTSTLNPNAKEWVPQGYVAPSTHQDSTPVIPYAPEDFTEITEWEVNASLLPPPPLPPIPLPSSSSVLSSTSLQCQSPAEDNNTAALLSSSGTQMERSANSAVCSSRHTSPSQSPEERRPKGSPVVSPAEDRERAAVSPQSTVSPVVRSDQVPVPAAQSSPTQTSHSPSDTLILSPQSPSAGPEKQSPALAPSRATKICLLVPECLAPRPRQVESATLEQKCQEVRTDTAADFKVPDSARMKHSDKGVPDGSIGGTISYARVVERATPSPPPPPPPAEEERYKGVEQPIPKIFQRDRTPPRELPPPEVTPQKLPELFRRPTKDQRTRSRKFLQELKESSRNGDDGDGDSDSGVGGDAGWCFSSPSSVSSSSSSSSSSTSSSSSCELPQSLSSSHIPSSPLVIPSSSSSSSSSSSQVLPSSPSSPLTFSPSSPLRCLPRSTPKVIPPPSPAGSPSRVRSESESSAASLDIDFVDDVDNAVSAVPLSATPSASAGKRPINMFLACILGSGDSDSEDEEDWDDWDEVCVDSANSANPHPSDLDDSWETFGIALECHKVPVDECLSEVVKQGQVGSCWKCPIDLTVPVECQAEEDKADDHTDNSYLAEVNERWARETGKEVPPKSASRVTFGGTTVHPMVAWGHAYREARRGPWEQQARDRARFKQRIGTAEAALSWVLQPSHRTAVYERLCAPNTTTTATTTTS